MRGRARIALLGMVACVALAPRAADACTCIGPLPACQAVWQAEAVFIGYVTAIEPVQRTIPPDLTQPTPDIFDALRVRMNVIETFRGSLPATIDLYTGAGGGDCGYAFRLEHAYVVYASQAGDGRLRTGICSNTRLLEAAEGDLDYLRRLPGLDSTMGTIQGTARLRPEVLDGRPAEPYAGARVIAVSDATRYETITGPDGSYELRVPVGTYDLRIDVPDDLLAGTWRTVDVRDARGCAQADIAIRANGRITGRIVTARGDPLVKQVVQLFRFERIPTLPGRPPREPYLGPAESVVTGQDGAFAFAGVAAGTYFVGVRLGEREPAGGRRAPILYPGTTDPFAATGVALASRGLIVMDDFVLPASVVLVRGTVRRFDGRPVSDVPVQFLSLDAAGRWAGSYDSVVRTGSDGSFQFPSRAGVLHRVVAGPDVEVPIFDVTPDMPAIEILLPE
jgi:hypothetical protein